MAIALVAVVVTAIGAAVCVAVRRHLRAQRWRARGRPAVPLQRRLAHPPALSRLERAEAPGALAGLSAVEARGRFTVVAAVVLVEPPDGSAPTAGPGGSGGPGGSAEPAKPPGSARPVGPVGEPPSSGDQAVKDQREVRATSRLRATCQIMRVERQASGTLVDLVTLRPCRVGGRQVPPGTPLALGFRPAPSADGAGQLATTAGRWEADGAVIDMAVDDTSRGTRYRFSCPEDHVALLVDAERV